MKRYEVLDVLPANGPMWISVSKDNTQLFSQGFVVKFFKQDGTDWVANFKRGATQLNDVVELSDKTIFVFAGGAIYQMDPDKIIPIRILHGNYDQIIATPIKDLYILSDSFVALAAMDSGGIKWRTERLAWDGLRSVRVDGNSITGEAYDAIDSDWKEFEVDINTGETLRGGGFRFEVIWKEPKMYRIFRLLRHGVMDLFVKPKR
ncbi:MAG: hypothetical protein HQL30_02535 [Candidatus Omnitrophica bacterium]|nr:hypothetical protein [Candidatus Omnitrophota bacterium]